MPLLTLPLGELEPLSRTLLAVLLSFMASRITREESELLQPASQLGIELHQCTGQPQLCGICLTAVAAAIGENQHIELFCGFSSQQWLPYRRTRTFRSEIVVQRPAVDSNTALAGPQEHTGYGLLSAAGTEILNQSCH